MSLTSSIGPNRGLVPALEIKMSMAPNFFSVSSTSFSLSPLLATWHWMAWTLSKLDPKVAKAWSTLPAFLLLITTLAPSWCSLCAMAKPILKAKVGLPKSKISFQNAFTLELRLSRWQLCRQVASGHLTLLLVSLWMLLLADSTVLSVVEIWMSPASWTFVLISDKNLSTQTTLGFESNSAMPQTYRNR